MPEKRKPGCRSRGCLIPLGIVGLLVGTFLGREIYLSVTATPGSAVNYLAQAGDLVDSYQPDEGENGWAAMLEAIAAYERAGIEDGEADLWSDAFSYVNDASGWEPLPGQPTADELVVIARRALGLIEREGTWDSLDEMAVAPRFARPLPPSGRMVMLLLPELGKMRMLARAVGADMHLAHRAGDDARAVQAATRGFALAKGCAHQITIIDRLVGIAISALVLDEIREELVARPHSAEQLDVLAELFVRYELPTLKLAFEGEHLSILDSIQWTHTDNGRGNGRLIVSQAQAFGTMGGPTSSVLPAGLVNLASIAYPSKKQTTAQANEMFELLYEQAEMSRQERLRQPDSADAFVMALPRRQMLLRMLMPALGRTIETHDFHAAIYAGTQTMVAIERFKAHQGVYPGSLDDLLLDMLSELPVDPYAKDGRFMYRKIDPAADPFGRGYLLYSVGFDGTDNGGTINSSTPINALKEGGRSIDFVFNLPKNEIEPASQPNESPQEPKDK